MPDAPRSPYQYAIIRVVPRVERGECLNVGVVLLCRSRPSSVRPPRSMRIACARSRRTPTPTRSERTSMPSSASPGATRRWADRALSSAERFHWLVAPASTMIQPSAVHTGLTDDPAAELERLFEVLVR